MTRRAQIITLMCALLLLLAFAINASGALPLLYPRGTRIVAELPVAPAPRAGQRVLIVSPHPDDESLCCAGSVRRALDAGADVWIVWLTNGDGFELDAVLTDRTTRPAGPAMVRLGEHRETEAARAAAALGVPRDHLLYLGYPDGGLEHLFLEHYNTPYTSRYTLARRVPYTDALTPGAAYTGLNVERDLARVLDRVRPDLILAPSIEDRHPDHRATGYFITRLLAARGQADRLRFWIVHGGTEYPLPKGLHPQLPLLIAPRGVRLAWERVPLTPEQEDIKRRAIEAHASQMQVMGRFLLAFVRRNELLTRQIVPELPTRP
ncbi:PIG-L deacetylase family protein [Deinococcus maricopensis]|uniref:LmbE family protein n=1 Tax=Deinococcus maricopensis (strain DSM 21211 / LMG 22137 / NRRL B-23946 / LB-34) TaxID=709986 RepID=E8U6N2_DEIML|nr:PIG-L family deacetylase [Deinococcus maricopensis]ADV66721.1 LmbE family protein [Deinococcus maricopensis DSM 21211]